MARPTRFLLLPAHGLRASAGNASAAATAATAVLTGLTARPAVAAPFGTDAKNFLAAFSNVVTALDVTGAGVGVVSTVPGGHAPMSGTSMACPAVTGVLARLLADTPAVLNMTRNADRSDAIKKLLFDRAVSLGLGVSNEGKGLPA